MASRGAGKSKSGSFEREVASILGRVAEKKGYSRNALWNLCGMSLPHALGEIVYKAIRYHRKRNPEDLVKIASWAKLIWENHNEGTDIRTNNQRDRTRKGNTRTMASPQHSKVHGVASRGNRGNTKGGERRDKNGDIRY